MGGGGASGGRACVGLRAGGSVEEGPWVGAWSVEALYLADLRKHIIIHRSESVFGFGADFLWVLIRVTKRLSAALFVS